jgi:tetratricopeptide (TPR) repeat protein
MKLIQGQTLAELLRQRPSPAHELPRFITVFGQLCQAVAYAHSRGVLHRDLKPSNVMVGAFGEVQVMDWGLAKRLGKERAAAALPAEEMSPLATVRSASADRSTQTGDVLGTPAYMAPEQARGEIDQLDERADVFGLGAMLCVLLTGKPPYLGSSSREVHPLAARGALEGAYARLDACGADPELVALARACLAPEPAQRPRHAGVVADAVATYQTQVQEKLRQAEMAQAQAQVQAREERKRRRLTVALALLLLVLLGSGGGVAWWSEQQQVERDKEEALRLAERDKERALRLAEARSGVEVALQEARGHAERARTLINNPASWQTTLAAALSAVERAESLLRREAELAQGALAQQAGQLRARLQADEKDRLLLAAFDRVREEQSQYDASKRTLKYREVYPRLKQALADYGLALQSLPADKAAARLQQRPPAVQEQLMGLLQECWYWAPTQAEAKRWLRALLAQADGADWRQQVRQAVEQKTGVALEELLRGPEVARQPAAFLVWLGRVLPPEVALGVLRRAQQQHPGDFWVNFELAGALHESVFGRGRADRPARAEELRVVNEAVAFFRVAVGLRPGNAPAHHNLGAALKAQGDLKGAIACYQKALELDPKYAKPHAGLGVVLQAQGDVKGAIECYTKALDLDPKLVHAHHNLGLALQAQGDVKGAIECYTKALDLDPKHARAHNNLGNALQAQGDVKGAIECYTKALKLDPKLAQAHYNLGNALRAQGDVSGAVACYQKVLDLDPKNAQAHTNLGAALEAQGDLKGAIACATKALDLDPKNVLAHNNLGNALMAQKDLKGAIASYSKALDLDPKYAHAHHNLGVALKAQGDLKGAIACYSKALTLDPKDAKAHYNLGNALYDQKDWKGAIACYRKALDLDPKYAHAHHNLGLALQAQGDVKGAMACYKKALDLDPKDAQAHYNLGVALKAQGDVKGAIACFHKALDLDPKDAQAHYNLGNALQAEGDVKGAIACYTKALDLDPKLAKAHNNLGMALQAQRDVKGAMACYEKALELDPKLVQAHYNLGNALYKQGAHKEAIACYKKALVLDPKLALAHYNLGLALKAQGDVQGAMACYRKALELDPKLAQAHGALGQALLAQGAFLQARAATQQALKLLPKGHPLRPRVTRQLHECQRLLELDSRLPALLQGDDQPKDSAEQLALADLCQRYRKRYAAAARFYADAFAAGAALTTQRAYNAACAAVLASAGQGEDASKLDSKEKTRLRQQALAWLRDSLKHYGQQLEDPDAKARTAVQQTLQHWQKDEDLSSVRDPKALAQLPQAERAAWQEFWAEVQTLLQKATK